VRKVKKGNEERDGSLLFYNRQQILDDTEKRPKKGGENTEGAQIFST